MLADQIVTEGSRSPADVFYTENSPPLEYLQGKGLLATVRQRHAGGHPGPVQLAAGRLGGRVGPGQRAHLQPSLISQSQLPTSVMQLADPKYKGKLALAAGETDFQPIVTSVAARLRRGGHGATG